MSGKSGRPSLGDRLQERARDLVERGLESYRQGDREAALASWRLALTVDIHAEDARDYIKRLESNQPIYDEADTDPQSTTVVAAAPEEQSPLDAIAPRPGSQPALHIKDFLGEALPIGRPLGDQSAARDQVSTTEETVQFTLPDPKPVAPSQPARRRVPRPGSQPSPAQQSPKPPGPRATLYGPPMPQPQQPPIDPESSLSPAKLEAQNTDVIDTQPVSFADLPTADTSLGGRLQWGSDQPGGAATPDDVEDEETEPISQQLPSRSARALAPTVELSYAAAETAEATSGSFDAGLATYPGSADGHAHQAPPPVIIEDVDPSEATYDDLNDRDYDDVPYHDSQRGPDETPHTPGADSPSAGRRPATAPGVPAWSQARESSGTVVSADDQEDTAPTPGSEVSLAHALLADLDAAAPRRLGDDEALQRRLSWLLEHAQAESTADRHSTALVALDLLFDEDPESPRSQKLIQRHNDDLIRIYLRYEGDLDKTPVVVIDAHEYGQHKLDNRAAFLLSRIDGVLNVEELLSVAGMPALEAHRHLCNLLRRGIVALR
ncbi:MAG: hypothetical protein Tsb0020_42280 [Haliangiales bacterium]